MSPASLFIRFCILLPLLGAAAGCVSVSPLYESKTAMNIPLASKVLMFPGEFLVMERKALSEAEPVVDKTEALKTQLTEALSEYMYENGNEFIDYGADTLRDEHVSIVRQAAVIVDATNQSNQTIKTSRYYGLGKESLNALSSYGADYALLVEYSETLSSTGKKVMAALVGGNSNTVYSYRVALFDLRDGQLVWSHDKPINTGSIFSSFVDRGDVVQGNRIRQMMTKFPL